MAFSRTPFDTIISLTGQIKDIIYFPCIISSDVTRCSSTEPGKSILLVPNLLLECRGAADAAALRGAAVHRDVTGARYSLGDLYIPGARRESSNQR